MKHSAKSTKSVVGFKHSLSQPVERRGRVLVACSLVLACFSFLQSTRAVSPPPDGGYPNGNTAEGENALFDLDVNSSSDNTAIGNQAMRYTEVATGNTAVGSQALEFGSTGSFNVAVGFNALFQNASGNSNTAIGTSAMGVNGAGSNNTAVGEGALFFNTDGNNNTCLGASSLTNTTGSNNIAVGNTAGSLLTTGGNNIAIGHEGNASDSNTIRIGKRSIHTKTVIAGIRGTTVAGGISVFVDANGRLGTSTSSARFKQAIKPMAKASEAILALQPVTFYYKNDLDPDGIPQFGLVAEEVAKVDPDLVARDDEGKPYTVRYEAVNAMLLNEFLKEHRKGQEQDATIAELKSALAEQQKEITALTASVKEQAGQIQKVRAEHELSSTTPRLVATNR